MISMSFAGTLCWIINAIFGIAFAAESNDGMTKRSVLLKGLVSFGIFVYAAVLILMAGEPSEASKLFTAGLFLIFVGDVMLALIQERTGGQSNGILKSLMGAADISRFGIGVAGVLFIVAYFMQMVAFIKGLSSRATASEYVMSFLAFFLLPLLLSFLAALFAKLRLPDVSTNAFIIGLFYVLLTSALFASASVFSFALFQEHPHHATWVFFGALLFFLSTLTVLLRYCDPDKFDSKLMRTSSRVMTFLARMSLAGCAFLF